MVFLTLRSKMMRLKMNSKGHSMKAGPSRNSGPMSRGMRRASIKVIEIKGSLKEKANILESARSTMPLRCI
jgi:hypothetical protein